MSRTDAARPTAPTPTPTLSASALRAGLLHAGWDRVRIDYVETDDDGDDGRRVRAVIHLGHLAPADVIVGLEPMETAGLAPAAVEHRMWSTESYDNGGYVFERLIPWSQRALAGDLIVSVFPGGGEGARPVLYPLRLDPPEDVRADRGG